MPEPNQSRATHEGFQLISFEWRYLYVNDVVIRRSGYAREELIGKTMMEIHRGLEHTDLYLVLKDCMEGRRSTCTEFMYTHRSSRPMWFELHVHPVPEGLYVLSIDITERKIAELQLCYMSERLERAVTTRSSQLELKQKELDDSLRYTKEVQQVFLATDAEFKRCFPESFIIYAPRDVVSGDFYWCRREERCVMIVAADCSGEGVRGALTSMMSIERLNLESLKTNRPATLLSRLFKAIKPGLGSDSMRPGCAPGLDIAVCAISNDRSAVTYAGVKRPLWIIRNGSSEVECIRGARRMPCAENPQTFTERTLTLSGGDTLYLFSDGYANTFGGSGSTKLTLRKFKEMLLKIQAWSMEDQETFLRQYIGSWRGANPQTDDILVMGVRV